MSSLTLTLVQTNPDQGEAEQNRLLLEREMMAMPADTDLVILPEMFTSSLASGGTAAEPWPGETLDWMRTVAHRFSAAVTGSIAAEVEGKRYNRLLFVTPEGDVHHYDKRHLFRMLNEHKRYAPGKQKTLVTWRGWKILPLVCYDLRFPVWCRNTREQDYDLMLFVANWPAARSKHWSRLLCARAIENLSFVAGVNRMGVDAKGIAYGGQSAVFDARGDALLQAGGGTGCYTVTISKAWLEDYRAGFPTYLDGDEFHLW